MKKVLANIFIIIFVFTSQLLSQGWQWVDTGYPYIIFDFSFPKGQSNIGFAVGSDQILGGNGIVLKSTDAGSSWVKVSADTIPGLKSVWFITTDVGYAGGFQNFLMETTDGGSTWMKIDIASKLWYFNNVEFWNADTGIAVSYPSSVYYTTDCGSSWSIAIGLKHNVEDLCYVNSNTLYLATADENIYRSTNAGFIWTEVYMGISQKTFSGIHFYNQNYGMVCGEDGKVMVTTNGGISWTERNTGGSGFQQAVHIFNLQDAYIVGTNEQVFKTTDSGATWFSDFSATDTVTFYKIRFTENNTGLICASNGKFLINTDYVVPVESNVTFSLPSEISLEQNYPNPFNPLTNIEFSLPQAGDVTLTIYNNLGEKLVELVNSHMLAGVYNYSWNAGNFVSGIYFCELRTDKYLSVKKMLLIK